MTHHITGIVAKAITRAAALLCAAMLTAPLAAPLCAHAETTTATPDVSTQILALQSVYPTGTPWTDTTAFYANPAWPYTGTGCTAFAMQISDAVYGKNTKVNILYGLTPNDIQVGDAVRIGGYHTFIVISVGTDTLTVCEGGYNGSVRWGRQVSKASLAGQITYIARRG